jgi:hypothetical protein
MAAQFCAEDRERFEVDPACIDWPTYVAKVHLPGLEKYAVKPPRTASPPAPLAAEGATLNA